MSGFLLDTMVISELIKPAPSSRVTTWVDETNEDLCFLSVLTLGEIRQGIAAHARGARRTRLEGWLESELRPRFAGRILDVTQSVADRWGALRGSAASRGRPLPVIDSLLAATALQYDLTLVSRNTPDVEHTGVRVFNPWVDR